jgi:hypothetical protein
MRELERTDAAVRGEVGVEHDEVRMIVRELEQRLAVRGGDVLVRDARARRRSRTRARRRSLPPTSSTGVELRSRTTSANALDSLAVVRSAN